MTERQFDNLKAEIEKTRRHLDHKDSLDFIGKSCMGIARRKSDDVPTAEWGQTARIKVWALPQYKGNLQEILRRVGVNDALQVGKNLVQAEFKKTW